MISDYVKCVWFDLTGAVARDGAAFGQGSGPILLESVACFGREENLLNCSNRGVGIHSCSHRQDAGIICQCKHEE